MQKSAFKSRGFLFVILSAIFIILLILFIVKILDYRLTKISVETSFTYTNKMAFNQKLRAKIGSPFWLLDLKKLKSELAQDPWLAKIELRRTLSGVLSVKAKEKTLFARWNNDFLLDTNFNILPDHPKVPVDLFMLMVDKDKLVYAGTLAQKFLLMFKSYGIDLNKATLSKSGLWTLLVEDKILIQLGKKNLDSKLNKLFFLWQDYLAQETDKIEALDLRYPNGLAIKKIKR